MATDPIQSLTDVWQYFVGIAQDGVINAGTLDALYPYIQGAANIAAQTAGNQLQATTTLGAANIGAQASMANAATAAAANQASAAASAAAQIESQKIQTEGQLKIAQLEVDAAWKAAQLGEAGAMERLVVATNNQRALQNQLTQLDIQKTNLTNRMELAKMGASTGWRDAVASRLFIEGQGPQAQVGSAFLGGPYQELKYEPMPMLPMPTTTAATIAGAAGAGGTTGTANTLPAGMGGIGGGIKAGPGGGMTGYQEPNWRLGGPMLGGGTFTGFEGGQTPYARMLAEQARAATPEAKAWEAEQAAAQNNPANQMALLAAYQQRQGITPTQGYARGTPGAGQGILVGEGRGIIPGVTEVLQVTPGGHLKNIIPIVAGAQAGAIFTADPNTQRAVSPATIGQFQPMPIPQLGPEDAAKWGITLPQLPPPPTAIDALKAPTDQDAAAILRQVAGLPPANAKTIDPMTGRPIAVGTSPGPGYIWNGVNWVPGPAGGGTGQYNPVTPGPLNMVGPTPGTAATPIVDQDLYPGALGGVAVTPPPVATGNIWNGSQWVPDTAENRAALKGTGAGYAYPTQMNMLAGSPAALSMQQAVAQMPAALPITPTPTPTPTPTVTPTPPPILSPNTIAAGVPAAGASIPTAAPTAPVTQTLGASTPGGTTGTGAPMENPADRYSLYLEPSTGRWVTFPKGGGPVGWQERPYEDPASVYINPPLWKDPYYLAEVAAGRAQPIDETGRVIGPTGPTAPVTQTLGASIPGATTGGTTITPAGISGGGVTVGGVGTAGTTAGTTGAAVSGTTPGATNTLAAMGNVPALQAVRTGQAPPAFQAYGAPNIDIGFGMGQLPYPAQMAATFWKLNPWQQEDVLQALEMSGVPRNVVLYQMQQATVGYRQNQPQAFRYG